MTIFAALFGLCIGSFLNVVIHRVPRGESIVHPRSRCPECQTPIAGYDNIPILSYLFLLGKCRHCKNKIAPRFPLVELISGILATAVYLHNPDLKYFIFYFCFFFAPLLAVIFIDLSHQIIPNFITFFGIVFGVLISGFFADPIFSSSVLMDRIFGILTGGGFLFLVGFLYEKLKKREGLGGGDVKLAAMFGAFFGWQAALFILLLSSVLGALFGVVSILILRKNWQTAIPFGPFLSISAYIYYFFGPPLLNWYLSLIHF